MDVSIIIPSFNTQDTIENTLNSVKEQACSCDIEVIIVDCSSHKQVKEISSRFEFVQYHHEHVRFNPGKGRNIGSEIASGELIIFMDADIRLEKSAVQNAWNYFNQGNKIFGGALELNRETSTGLSSWVEHFFFNHESQANRPSCERSNLSSALMCFDREEFLSGGGFKDIPRMQDTELTERMKKKGFSLRFSPDVLAYQTQDSAMSKVLRKIYINGQNLYYIRYQSNISFVKKVAFFILLPLIGLAKVLRIIGRHLRYQPWKVRLITIALALPLGISTLYWIAGFYNALIFEKGISETR